MSSSFKDSKEQLVGELPASLQQFNEESPQRVLCNSKNMPARKIVSKLIDAVRQGRLEEVKDFINTNDIVCFPKLWNRLLQLAVTHEKPEIAEFLLKFDCNVNNNDRISDPSALHIAARNFYLEIVQTLLDKHANVDARDKRKRTPLIYAMTSSIRRKQPGREIREDARRRIIELLVNYGADVNSSDYVGNTPLHVTVDKNDIKTMKFLLDNKAVPDSKNKLGKTPLYCAIDNDIKCRKRDYEFAKKTRKEMVELLINRGAGINAHDCDGKTPIRIVVDKKDTEMVEFLLEKNVNLDVRDKFGKTALHYVIDSKASAQDTKVREKLIKLLLKDGADVNIGDLQGLTLLHTLAKKFELQQKNKRIYSRWHPTRAAIEPRDISEFSWTVDKLLQHGANINCVCNHPDFKGFTPLHFAAKLTGCSALVEILLKNGADINAVTEDNKTPLGLASINGNDKTVETILNYGPNIKNENKCRYLNIVIHKTAQDRFSETAEEPWYEEDIPEEKREKFSKILNHLLQSGITLDERDENSALLKAAIVGGSEEIVEQLLDNGADVNLVEVAADYDKTEMVSLLLHRGGNVNVKDEKGNSPLFYAARNNNLIMMKIILSSPTKVNIHPEVLNAAVVLGNREMVDTLFAYDPEIDVNAVDEKGETALFCATRKKYNYFKGYEYKNDTGAEIEAKAEIGKLLLSRGANPETRTTSGLSVFAEAVVNSLVKLVEALLERGIDAKPIIKKYGGLMAIHYASCERTSALAETILKSDPDVLESVDYDGKTALQMAVSHNFIEPVKIFLDYRANVDEITECDDHQVIEILNHHRLKLMALNRPVSEHFLQWLNSHIEDEYSQEFEKKCEEECKNMKDAMIGNTSLSFYDIAVKNVHQLAIYMKNQSIVEHLKSSELEKKFPIYASFIRTNFTRAVQRKELLRLGLNTAVRLFGEEWPDLVLEDVLSNLSNTDLRKFVMDCSSTITDEM